MLWTVTGKLTSANKGATTLPLSLSLPLSLPPINNVCGLQHSPPVAERATVLLTTAFVWHSKWENGSDTQWCILLYENVDSSPDLHAYSLSRYACTVWHVLSYMYCLKCTVWLVLSYMYCPDFRDTHTPYNYKNVFCIIIFKCTVLCYCLYSYTKDKLYCPICMFCLILQNIVWYYIRILACLIYIFLAVWSL